MPDKVTFKESGVSIEAPDEPANPHQLAELMIQLRHAHPTGLQSQLSDEGVHKLLEMAFYLSLKSDEGRFPRFSIIAGLSSGSRLDIQLSKPIEFTDVNELRRITPVAESSDFALVVSEIKEGTLECCGLKNVGPRGYQSQPGRPEIITPGDAPSFRIWINEPGHLTVMENSACFEYKAGRVKLVVPALFYVPKLNQMLKTLGQTLHKKAASLTETVSGADSYFGGYGGLSSIVNVVIDRLLQACLELRHGGAFVVLPDSKCEPETYGISCK